MKRHGWGRIATEICVYWLEGLAQHGLKLLIIPVILSGGSGTRLWPLSRQLYPKQLLPLVDQATMLQQTALRISGRANIGRPIVSCNEQHRFLVAEQLREIKIEPVAILLEPTGRNTAPAAAVAAIHAINSTPNDNPLLLVLPADHVIADPSAFLAALDLAEAAALAGDLVTFGVVPTRAETGYGYIRSRAKTGENNNSVRAVAEFVEKPTETVAAEYVQSGDYLWNSGMFLFSAAAYLEELRRFAPAIADACKVAITEASVDLDFLRLDCDAFTECPNDSIDFAVMEKTDRAVVVPLDAGWSDVGSFGALFDVLTKDANGNVFAGDVIAVDTRNSLISAESRLVTAVGVEDCVVIETKDSVLVSTRERSQNVRHLVDQLRQDGRTETELHRQVYRPWGSYDSIDQGDGFQVKRLIVNRGAKLSVQMHHQRDEHWTVVAGTARVTRDDDQYLLEKNESTFIPRGTKHSIENPGTKPLHVIEVQVGDYLGEDDIVRFEDRYGRAGES